MKLYRSRKYATANFKAENQGIPNRATAVGVGEGAGPMARLEQVGGNAWNAEGYASRLDER